MNNHENQIKWHSLKPDKVWASAKSNFNLNENGLDIAEIEKTRAEKNYGYNEIIAGKKESWVLLLLSQFNNMLIYILVAAAVISIFLGKVAEPIAILVIVALAGILGFIQEFSAEKAIENLTKLAAPFSTVFRNGKEIQIPSRELIPGDIIIIKSGDKMPADGRIIEAINLKVDESAFTGESLPVEKVTDGLQENISLGDMINSVFTGTTAVYGRGKAIVTSIGMNTNFGKIAAKLMNTKTSKTPLQKNIDQLGKKLGIFAIILALVVGFIDPLLNNFTNFDFGNFFLFVVALAVAIVPEALPAVVTITLANSVTKMSKRHALIRKLPAVETLGATQIICSDKTGTLTKNEMTVKKVFLNGKVYDVNGLGYEPIGNFVSLDKIVDKSIDNDLSKLLVYSSLCNDSTLAKIENLWKITGDPTEAALIVASKKYDINFEDVRKKYPRVFEIPFTSESKRMTTVHEIDGKLVAISKGAQEIIINSCSNYYDFGKSFELTSSEKENILSFSNEFANNALRILAISFKELKSKNELSPELENEMTFLGFFGMIDPPREEVKEAIKICKDAMITTVMITGDHKITAVAVARELGIYSEDKHLAISGVEFEKLDDDYLEKNIDKYRVFARISPFHKLKIVEILQKKGKIVAMTGDGINDAPSLKKADIGVAMGITGTDVSKEAADMILTDDNFASIVSAIEEGRVIFDNIRKYLIYLLSGNIGTVLALTLAILAGFTQPLTAVQILFINFVMDGLMAIALSNEPAEGDVMKKPPRDSKIGIMDKLSVSNIAVLSVILGLVAFASFWIHSNIFDKSQENILFFLILILSRIFNGIVCKSLTSFRLFNLGNNLSLFYSGIITLGLTLVILYSPPFQIIFGIDKNPEPILWGIAVCSAVLFWILAELYKRFFAKKIEQKEFDKINNEFNSKL